MVILSKTLFERYNILLRRLSPLGVRVCTVFVKIGVGSPSIFLESFTSWALLRPSSSTSNGPPDPHSLLSSLPHFVNVDSWPSSFTFTFLLIFRPGFSENLVLFLKSEIRLRGFLHSSLHFTNLKLIFLIKTTIILFTYPSSFGPLSLL